MMSIHNKPVTPSDRWAIDCACYPHHISSNTSHSNGPLQPSHTTLVTATQQRNHVKSLKGGATVHTIANNLPLTINLPGSTLFSTHYTHNLIALQTLVNAGYSATFRPKGMTISTPDNKIITCEFLSGLWYLPAVNPPEQEITTAATITTPITKPHPAPHTRAHKKGKEEPSHLSADLDKIDRYHLAHGHPGTRRMRLAFKAMSQSDPDKLTNMSTLYHWPFYRACATCKIGDMERPNLKTTHPPTNQPQVPPGTKLNIDSTGQYSAPVIGNYEHSIQLTDQASNFRWSFPAKDFSTDAVVDILKRFQAASPVKIKHIHTDSAYLYGAVDDYCIHNNIRLTGCAPNTHQQAPQAEGTVKQTKRIHRKNQYHACTPLSLQAKGHQYAARQLNDTPWTGDPTGQNRTPHQIWPEAPFQHPNQHLWPWGCLAIGHIGKVTSDPNTANRGRPGIFCGFPDHTPGYTLYHIDTSTLVTYGYIHPIPNRFPLREIHLMGETANTIIDGTWRGAAIYAIDEAPDEQLAHYVVGKQLQLTIPTHINPTYKHQWTAVATKVVKCRDTSQTTAVRLIYNGYKGDTHLLSPADKTCLEPDGTPLYIDVPVSPIPHKSTTPATLVTTINIRSLLHHTYPYARTLSDAAASSVATTGRYPKRHTPLTAAAAQREDKQHEPPAYTHTTHNKGTSKRVTFSENITTTPNDPTPRRVTRSMSTGQQLTPNTHVLSSLTQAHTNTSHRIGFTPSTLRQARAHSSAHLWQAALDKELLGLQERGTWTPVDMSQLPPNTNILGTKLTFTDKDSGPRVRLVARGDQEYPKATDIAKFAPTPAATEVRLIIWIATENAWSLLTADISQAFVQSDDLDQTKPYYIRLPKGVTIPGTEHPPSTVYKLKKPLYGLAISSKAWSDTLKKFLFHNNFNSVNCSDTLFVYTQSKTVILFLAHVDDCLVTGTPRHALDNIIEKLLSRFQGRNEGEAKRFVGVNIHRDTSSRQGCHTTTISQEHLTQALLDEHKDEVLTTALTPMSPGTLLLPTKDDHPVVHDPKLTKKYQRLCGSMMYLSVWTRPDISFAVQQLAKYMANPQPHHWDAAIRLLRYLKHTPKMGITYRRSYRGPDHRLYAFADSDFAACPITRRSYNAFLTMLGGGVISWRCRQQKSVATSTTESEFVAASNCADEVLWIRRILEYFAPQTGPTPLFEDNRACRMLSENPVRNERTKHIDYRVHSLRERVRDGVVTLIDCPTKDMLADALTKALPSPAFTRHRDTMMGNRHHPLIYQPPRATHTPPRAISVEHPLAHSTRGSNEDE